MASVYKKFTAQDKALIPFNAHKQYNFTSASATTNQVKHFNSNNIEREKANEYFSKARMASEYNNLYLEYIYQR